MTEHLKTAIVQASAIGGDTINAEHLMLGLLKEPEKLSVAFNGIRVLQELGIDPKKFNEELAALMRPNKISTWPNEYISRRVPKRSGKTNRSKKFVVGLLLVILQSRLSDSH